MKVVILAAGFGSRLKNLTENKGKALVELKSRPLIDYAIAFTDRKCVSKRYIVGGYTFDKLKSHIDSLSLENTLLIENKDYKKGNILTLEKAMDYFDDDMLVMNVDHVYNPKIFDVITSDFKGIRGVVDHDRVLGDDDMKVKLDDNGKIKHISKTLSDFDKGYIGMTLIAKDSLSQYKQAFNDVLNQKGDSSNVEAVLQMLSDTSKPAGVVDVSSYKWLEIDNQDELKAASIALDEYPETFSYFKG